MDRNNSVLDISSDEDVEWNDHGRGVSNDGDDYNWFAGLLDEVNKASNRDDADAVVVVVSESENTAKKSKLKSSSVDLDDDDDCVILDSDPNEPVEVRNDNSGNGDDDSDDLLVVSEKGQIACRDYPHSRHLCIKFPFSTTPNQSHCNQCYCYVCDLLAPCVYWGNGTAATDHCHATDKDEFWKLERKKTKRGCRLDQPVSHLPAADHHIPGRTLVQVQPQYPIPRPGPIRTHQNITDLYRNNVLASRTKVHPDLASQYLIRSHQKYNLGSRVHGPGFKRTGPVRGNFGNLSRQQNQNCQVNGMQYRSNRSLTSLQQNAVRSPAYTSSTVNPQPLICQPQVPNLHSCVNSNPFPEPPFYQQPQPVPPFTPQPASYIVPAQQTRVDSSPMVPVPDPTQNLSQGNQAPGPISDLGDYGPGWPASQHYAGSTNDSTLGTVASGLADYQYDWIFDDQPIEPGFTDYSSDSAFIDTGPIFDF